MRPLIPTLAAALALAGCAEAPEAVAPAPVAITTYSSMSCPALVAEETRVVESVNQLTAAQRKKSGNDAAAMAVGMVLFWPALFALGAGSDVAPQLAQAKGQHDAIRQARAMRGC